MKPKLFVIYLFIVLLPLGLLAWLGTELARDEQSRVQVKFRELMANQLAVRKQAIEAGEWTPSFPSPEHLTNSRRRSA